MRALELFCGIGGFSAAVSGTNVTVACAIDRDADALATYRLNFSGHRLLERDMERISAWELSSADAGIWWMSPPCQPYCGRGAGRDIDDNRARSLLRVLDILSCLETGRLPGYIALENVEGFRESRARELLLAVLGTRGYAWHEISFCPTMIGIPSRRPRYYLVASREAPPSPLMPCMSGSGPLRDYLDAGLCDSPPDELLMDDALVERYGSGMRILDRSDDTAYTTCFTSAYGKSIMASGAYLSTSRGIRRFSPREIAALLHFPDDFRFPEGLTLRRKWHLLGNSLSVASVREILRMCPEIRW